MEKVNRVLTILIILVGAFTIYLMFDSEFNIRVKAFMRSDINLIYEDSMIGRFYMTESISFQENKLIEYRWKNNFVLAGNIYFGVDSVFEENTKCILKRYEQSGQGVTTIGTDDYKLLFLIINEKENDKIITFIYDFENQRGLRIYGRDYTFDESCRAAQIVLYGKPSDYTILTGSKISHSEDYKENEK